MPLRFIARLRRHRGPAAILAAGLIALQTFVAGLAMAEAAVALTPELGAGFAVICHGIGGPASDPGSAPAPKDWHPCCVACAAGAGAASLPALWDEPSLTRLPVAAAPRWHRASLPSVPRAVRAGLSQAPPPSFV